jgi:hypothetical protein
MRNGTKRDLIIYCDRASGAASELARRLGARRIYSTSSRRIVRTDGSLIVNYGTSHQPSWGLGDKSILLNDPEKVRNSISKVLSYGKFRETGVPTLEFTTQRGEAEKWLSENLRVLGRTDRLSSGRGIHIYEPGTDGGTVGDADFYAKYFPKTHEYRIHVVRVHLPVGQENTQCGLPGTSLDSYRVIDITQKKRATLGDGEGGRTLYQRVVRSLDNGWVHAHEDVHLPAEAKVKICEAAINAVCALELDFGAVDVVARFKKKAPEVLHSYAILEVNTAPGLGNEVTIKAYHNAFIELYNGTKASRAIPIRRRVRKLVKVQIVTRKGNKVWRDRYRYVYE